MELLHQASARQGSPSCSSETCTYLHIVSIRKNNTRNALPVLALFVVPLVLLGSPTAALAQNDVDSVAWLSGCWVASAGEVRTEEDWMAPEGGLMVGMSRTVRAGVATGYEFLLLRLKDGRLTYSAHPSGQDPADFQATYVSTERVRFEAPEHDFPRAIEYERTSADSLTAKVYGEIGMSEPAFVLRYTRRAC